MSAPSVPVEQSKVGTIPGTDPTLGSRWGLISHQQRRSIRPSCRVKASSGLLSTGEVQCQISFYASS